MRASFLPLSLALVAATATVASASSRDRDRHDDADRAHAHEHGGERSRGLGPVDPAYAKECGACHVPYPPALLPRAAWRSIMAGLEHHFGDNAELPEETRAKLERWIVEGAAPDRRSRSGESLRITEQPWFVDEHDEVPAGATAQPELRSMANCAGCHAGAESWDFDEHRVRMPRGG